MKDNTIPLINLVLNLGYIIDWAPQVQANVSVKVDILVVFPLGNTTKRPASFIVTETIGTNAPFRRPTISNP